ncbi:Hpt domain-containing protein [Parasphingorhabdus sp. DH2-15]|jgi:hypothetical protein|uniref:Hpt domain-containing protein n=1 Tax=Parasphingorhabdus sp. DH2-15 TaxID=3444112 RepID=UPI003F68588D
MAHYENDFTHMLSSSLGEDPELVAQLQTAFLDAVGTQIDLMSRSRCDGNWYVSAERLCGIAASFSAEGLLDLGRKASAGAPGDPVIVRELREWLAEFTR